MTLLPQGVLQAARDTLQLVSAAVVAVVGFCYAAGLFVVNLHLAMFGVFSFGFAQTEYVLAGALLVFLVVFIRVAYDYGSSGIAEGITQIKEGAILFGLVEIVFFLTASTFFPVALVHFLSGHGGVLPLSWQPWATVAVLGVIAFLLNATQHQAIFAWRDFKRSDIGQLGPSARKALLFRVLQPVLPLLGALFVYALLCYPMMYPAFGGGHHDVIFVIPTAEGAKICRTAKLPSNAEGSVFGPLEVVVETSDETVVRAPKQLVNIRAVRLKRDLFAVVLNRRSP